MLKEFKKRIQECRQPEAIYNDDIFLVSFPKSGNTWLSFLLGNILALMESEDREVNFFTVQDFIPEYGNKRIKLRDNGVAGFPRIIKSHAPLTDAFPKVLLLVRDPRDVMVSYYHYLKGLKRIPGNWTIDQLVQSHKYGIDAWVGHTRGWLERATAGQRVRVYRYEDFLQDPLTGLKNIMAVMGREVDATMLERAVELSSFDNMREAEKKTRNPQYPLEKRDFRFVRKGSSGEGQELSVAAHNAIASKAGELINILGYGR